VTDVEVLVDLVQQVKAVMPTVCVHVLPIVQEDNVEVTDVEVLVEDVLPGLLVTLTGSVLAHPTAVEEDAVMTDVEVLVEHVYQLRAVTLLVSVLLLVEMVSVTQPVRTETLAHKIVFSVVMECVKEVKL